MKQKDFSFSALVRHLLLSWLLAALLEFVLLTPALRTLSKLSGIQAMSLPRMLILTVLLTAGLWLLSCRKSIAPIERWSMAGVFAVLSAFALSASFSWSFLGICLLVLGILIVYALHGHCAKVPVYEISKDRKIFPLLAAGLAVLFFAMVSVWTVFRYLGFATPTYDFGIFAQMFHNMRTLGQPITTLERTTELSHFAVHVSPIYYLMLPFYCLFPSPITLQILQAAVMASAVIPLWLICRRNGLSGKCALIVCAVFLLLPANAGGAYYDLHENCFLLPLILWLMYALERGNIGLTVLFSLLTLAVKEDAAVYVAVAGLFACVQALVRKGSRKELLTGVGVLIGAIAYFLLVTAYLSEHGDGVMTYRYNNFMYDGSGSLFTVIKAVLLCPMKMLYECADREKLEYIALTLLPLLGLPLLTRRYERYILLIPYVLINLMSDYTYQHDVLFQYNFGSTAFLIYLFTVNLADLSARLPRIGKLPTRAAVPCLALLVAAVCFAASVMPSIQHYTVRYLNNRVQYDTEAEFLSQIPEDAVVTATTFYTSHLSQRRTLYDLDYASAEQIAGCDYVIISNSAKKNDQYGKYFKGDMGNAPSTLAELLEQAGFVEESTCYSITVYRKTS